MTSTEHYEKRWSWKRRFRRSVFQLVIIFVLYILSTGPMYWIWFSAYYLHGSEYIEKLYNPIVLACEIDVINDFFDWYVGLWIH
jgi:hypothetical protein